MNHKFVKIISPVAGIGLAIVLILFLGTNSTLAQDIQETPSNGAQSTPDALILLEKTAQRRALLATVALDWTAPYTDPVKSIAWGDYDLDGDLDLLIGNGIGENNRLYENNNGTLTSIWTGSCTSASDNTSSVTWMDYDRDGDLDFAVGVEGGRNCAYENDGGTFTRIWHPTLPQNTNSVAAAGWVLSDNYLSYLAIGNLGGNSNAIYSFNSFGIPTLKYTFSESYNTESLAWGDFDQDGLPDLAFGNFNDQTIIFRNESANHSTLRFTAAFTLPINLNTKSVSWGDMDNDGDLDLAIGNGYRDGTTHKDYVYCNSGSPNYNFSQCWESNDTSRTSSVSWGDYDGDGDLDLAAAGDYQATTRVYLNTGSMLETGAASVSFGDSGYTANTVAWTDLSGDGDLELTIAYDGNPIYGSSKQLEIVDDDINDDGDEVKKWKLINFEPGGNLQSGSSLAWGDVNNDGYPDLVVGNDEGDQNQLYINNSGSGLTPSAWNPPAGNTRSLAWGDMDGDGDLDLAVGNDGTRNRVYENITGMLNDSHYSNFVDGQANYSTYAIAWGDYDGDGDLDLVDGNFSSSQSNRIFINRGGIFTETIPVGTSSDSTTSLAWGDFDQDYDLDLLVGNTGGADRVLVNDGNGGFSNITLPTPTGSCASNDTYSVAWADWDADGDLDIALGLDGCARVLTASGSGSSWSFSQAWIDDQNGSKFLGIAWGDYNGDGLADLAAAVDDLQFGDFNRVYRNTGGDLSLYWLTPVVDLDTSRAVAWADFDNDSDLDFAIINTSAASLPDRLYINPWHTPATEPSAGLANDPSFANIWSPTEAAYENASFFSQAAINGEPMLAIGYNLYDNEGDAAYLVQHQVSWDGGHNWEAAWEYMGSQSGNWSTVSASPDGTSHIFYWDALNQLLDHQGIPFNPTSNTYADFIESFQEMDVAFRVVSWSNPEHGGPIQRPRSGGYTSMIRIDMRPDWDDSDKVFNGEIPEVIHPDDTLDLSIVITQTDHGMPPEAYMIDRLPPGLYLPGYDLASVSGGNTTEIISDPKAITWTGTIAHEDILIIDFSPKVTRPLENESEVTNCANIYDGLHEPFERCLTFVISSTPVLTESWKLVNDVTSTISLPGDILTYTIVLTNTGTDNARSAVMTDVISTDAIWQNDLWFSSGEAAYNDGTIIWQGDINVFDPVVLTYTVQVKDPLPGNTLITNTFSLQDNINPIFIAHPVTTTVDAPDLRPSTKSAYPAEVELGDPVYYTITLRNEGSMDALPAYLWDPMPGTSSYIADSLRVSRGDAFGYDSIQEEIYWHGDMEIGDLVTITFGVYADLWLSYDGILTNTVYITDSIGGLITVVATNTVNLPDMSASYKLATPEEVDIGNVIDYSIHISNVGGYGPNISASDPIPEDASYVPNSLTSSDGNASYNEGSNTINWGNTLWNGDSASFSYQMVAGCPNITTTSSISNVVYIEDSVGRITERIAATHINLPDISTSTIESSLYEALPGDEINYVIHIRNTGVHGENLWMSDQLPNELILLGTYTTTIGTLTYSEELHRLLWEGELDNGEEVMVTYQVQVRENMINDTVTHAIEVSNGCSSQIFNAPPLTIIEEIFYRIYMPIIFR